MNSIVRQIVLALCITVPVLGDESNRFGSQMGSVSAKEIRALSIDSILKERAREKGFPLGNAENAFLGEGLSISMFLALFRLGRLTIPHSS